MTPKQIVAKQQLEQNDRNLEAIERQIVTKQEAIRVARDELTSATEQTRIMLRELISGFPQGKGSRMFFLIDYDRAQGRPVELRTFDDASHEEASDARLELELSLSRRDIKREVVLLQAGSEADLRRTHRRYFESLAELSEPRRERKLPNVAEDTADYRLSRDE